MTRAAGLEHLPGTGECEHSDRSSAKRDSNMHAASKTATAFLKATNTKNISHGTPDSEDNMTAAAVEALPLLTRHSPIPLELAEASAQI